MTGVGHGLAAVRRQQRPLLLACGLRWFDDQFVDHLFYTRYGAGEAAPQFAISRRIHRTGEGDDPLVGIDTNLQRF